jgi:OmcA/MtrC family decaheme c-type cytochrome
MKNLQNGLVILAALSAGAIPLATSHLTDDPYQETGLDPKAMYQPSDAEYYLTADEYGYARPGLTVEVVSVEFPADGHPVVEFTYVDDLGQPLDRSGIQTPGSISFSFILSWYDAENRDYVAYTTRVQTSPITGDSAEQAGTDSGGTIEDLEMGRSRYTFGTELPADFDGTKTHSVGIYSTRSASEVLDKEFEANVVFDVVPAGGQPTEIWDAVADETCNACHEQLALHGGHRRDVKLCMLCHNRQTIDPDTGNTVDMKVMIHKIHMGANLPSVQDGMPYQIIGYRQSVHDYSEVLYPMDVRNCESCHTADKPEGHIWFTRPTRDACGSCHDNIDWVTGEGHRPGPQEDDSRCANCHQPEGDREFDISIVGAHTIPTKSMQLAGLNMEILDVRDAGPGMRPTIDFRLTNDDGSVVDHTTLDSLRILAGGSTTDYSEYVRETVSGATVDGDVVTYTFEDPLPEEASGTWAFSADAYRFVIIDDGSDEGLEVREAAYNPIFFAAVTDDEPLPRREVVSLDKCNVCHDTLALHGGQRFAIEECVICHHANETDESVRPGDELPPESVHFKWLIHRIHMGHGLANDFTVYGFRGSVHNYNHVGYPGDLRTCEACHLPGTYGVPTPEGSLPTLTERDYYSPTMPAAAACNSCHSTVDAAAHAYTNTAPFGESCASCHGDNREFSVEKVHAH